VLILCDPGCEAERYCFAVIEASILEFSGRHCRPPKLLPFWVRTQSLRESNTVIYFSIYFHPRRFRDGLQPHWHASGDRSDDIFLGVRIEAGGRPHGVVRFIPRPGGLYWDIPAYFGNFAALPSRAQETRRLDAWVPAKALLFFLDGALKRGESRESSPDSVETGDFSCGLWEHPQHIPRKRSTFVGFCLAFDANTAYAQHTYENPLRKYPLFCGANPHAVAGQCHLHRDHGNERSA
jgi:hypothetical protein